MNIFYLICAGLFLLAGTFVMTTAQMQTTQTSQTTQTTATPKPEKFWMEAAQGGMTEVELSNLALQKSQSEEVKTFAQMMVDDHTKANEELKMLAQNKNVTLPTEMNAKQMAMKDKLNGLSGDAFDREYMKMMVKDHDKTVKLFQKQADSGKDEEVKAFAAKTLPTLQSHQSKARAMNDSMKGKKGMEAKGKGDTTMMNTNSGSTMNTNSNTKTNSNMSMNSNMTMNGNMMMNGNMPF